jgi:hypothetical protein
MYVGIRGLPGRHVLSLWFFGPVLRPPLLAVIHATCVQCSTDDVIANTGKIPDSTTTDQHHGVLLKIVSLARNVGSYFHSIRQTNAGNLPKRRVWLLRRHRSNLGTYATLLRRTFPPSTPSGIATSRVVRKLQRRRLGLLANRFPPFSDQLIDRRHAVCSPPEVTCSHRRQLAPVIVAMPLMGWPLFEDPAPSKHNGRFPATMRQYTEFARSMSNDIQSGNCSRLG